MMDMGWVAAVITALGGLFGLFFGRSHWKMLQGLVDDLEETIDEQKTEIKALRQRLDLTERAYHQAVSDVRLYHEIDDNHVDEIGKLKRQILDLKRLLDNREHL